MKNNIFSQKGFNLLELIVVMSLLAFIYTALIPWMQKGLDHYKLANTTREIVSFLKQARAVAIGKNEDLSVIFDVDDKTFTSKGNDIIKIDPDIDIEVFAAESQIKDDNRAGIRFYSDGSTTGGRITLVYEDEFREIDIVWITGIIRVLDIDPET